MSEASWAASEWRVEEKKRGVKEGCLDWHSSARYRVSDGHYEAVNNF